MAQIVHRANLNAAGFPFLSDNQGRTVIVRGQDTNYVPSITSKEDQDKAGIPQIYYCHNVFPVEDGIQSIGYDQLSAAVSTGETGFRSIFVIKDDQGNKAFFCKLSDTRAYVLLNGSSSWVATTSVPSSSNVQVTTAYVNGKTYIFYEGVGCFYFDWGTSQLVSVTLTGLTISSIIGITAAAGYMIAWTKNSIAWSSTLDPTDFTPSLTTGAGGGSVQQVKGNIVFCFPNMMGFIIYTTDNAVVALFSNNSRYPFNYREIVSSGGVTNPELVAFDSDSANHYCYSTDGMQLVTSQNASQVFPGVTDFISGAYFEDFDETTLTFSSLSLASPMLRKITVVSSRYLVVSYGVDELTHALVYDIGQKRWGKLKVTHTDCFEYATLNPEQTDTPKKALCFLQKDGTIKQVNFSIGAANTSGVLLLGKYQYIRTRSIQLDIVEIENIRASSNFKLYTEANLDGKSGTFTEGNLLQTSGLVRKYGFRKTGINHSILFKGGFYAVSVTLTFNIHGRR